jgi:hypothetical protein
MDIAPGTSLRLRYGELSNEELLLGSGFVLYHNPFDRLVVPPRALAYALQASVESFQRALALNDTQDFLSEADAKTLASKQVCASPVSASPAFALRFHSANPSTFTHSTAGTTMRLTLLLPPLPLRLGISHAPTHCIHDAHQCDGVGGMVVVVVVVLNAVADATVGRGQSGLSKVRLPPHMPYAYHFKL